MMTKQDSSYSSIQLGFFVQLQLSHQVASKKNVFLSIVLIFLLPIVTKWSDSQNGVTKVAVQRTESSLL